MFLIGVFAAGGLPHNARHLLVTLPSPPLMQFRNILGPRHLSMTTTVAQKHNTEQQRQSDWEDIFYYIL